MKKSAKCWPEFIEAVDLKLSTVHIIYKYCKISCRHPNQDASKSISNMQKHLNNCPKYRAYIQEKASEEPIGQGQKDLIYNFMGGTILIIVN